VSPPPAVAESKKDEKGSKGGALIGGMGHSAVLCNRCQGVIKEGLPYVVCGGCMKYYHKPCADRIGVCPNCKTPLD